MRRLPKEKREGFAQSTLVFLELLALVVRYFLIESEERKFPYRKPRAAVRISVVNYLLQLLLDGDKQVSYGISILLAHSLRDDRRLMRAMLQTIETLDFSKQRCGRIQIMVNPRWREEVSPLLGLLRSPLELQRLLFSFSQLRMCYFDGFYKASETINPVDCALSNGDVFGYKNFELVPTTDSFRRHVVGVRQPHAKSLLFEIKMPGQEKDRDLIHSWHYAFARDCQEDPVLRHAVPKPVALLTTTGRFFLYDRWITFSADNPLRLVIYEYCDGKRLTRIKEHQLQAAAAYSALLNGYDTASEYRGALDRIFVQVALIAKALLDRGFVGESSNGNDWHLENFKLCDGLTVMFVADFGAFRRKSGMSETYKKEQVRKLLRQFSSYEDAYFEYVYAYVLRRLAHLRAQDARFSPQEHAPASGALPPQCAAIFGGGSLAALVCACFLLIAPFARAIMLPEKTANTPSGLAQTAHSLTNAVAPAPDMFDSALQWLSGSVSFSARGEIADLSYRSVMMFALSLLIPVFVALAFFLIHQPQRLLRPMPQLLQGVFLFTLWFGLGGFLGVVLFGLADYGIFAFLLGGIAGWFAWLTWQKKQALYRRLTRGLTLVYLTLMPWILSSIVAGHFLAFQTRYPPAYPGAPAHASCYPPQVQPALSRLAESAPGHYQTLIAQPMDVRLVPSKDDGEACIFANIAGPFSLQLREGAFGVGGEVQDPLRQEQILAHEAVHLERLRSAFPGLAGHVHTTVKGYLDPAGQEVEASLAEQQLQRFRAPALPWSAPLRTDANAVYGWRVATGPGWLVAGYVLPSALLPLGYLYFVPWFRKYRQRVSGAQQASGLIGAFGWSGEGILYLIATFAVGAYLIPRFGKGMLCACSRLALKTGPWERGQEIVFFLSSKDPYFQLHDLVAILFVLRPYWWFKGYQLRVHTDATVRDLKAALLDPDIRNIAVMGHGNWDSWEASDGVMCEDDVESVMAFADKKDMFLTYMCSQDARRRASGRFGESAVSSDRHLRGANGIATESSWYDLPQLCALHDMRSGLNRRERFLHSRAYHVINRILLAVLIFSFATLFYAALDILLIAVCVTFGYHCGILPLALAESIAGLTAVFLLLSAFCKAALYAAPIIFNLARLERARSVEGRRQDTESIHLAAKPADSIVAGWEVELFIRLKLAESQEKRPVVIQKAGDLSVPVVAVDGLYLAFGQFGYIDLFNHVGLQLKGKTLPVGPVVYVDREYPFEATERALVVSHELFEVNEWELFRRGAGMYQNRDEGRVWTWERIEKEFSGGKFADVLFMLAGEFHNRAPSVETLFAVYSGAGLLGAAQADEAVADVTGRALVRSLVRKGLSCLTLPQKELLETSVILLLEDNADLQAFYQRLLREFVFEVLIAGNGREALDAIHREGVRPCGVLSDCQMPVMTGQEFAEEFAPAFPDIPLVLHSTGVRTRMYLAAGPGRVPLCAKSTGEGIVALLRAVAGLGNISVRLVDDVQRPKRVRQLNLGARRLIFCDGQESTFPAQGITFNQAWSEHLRLQIQQKQLLREVTAQNDARVALAVKLYRQVTGHALDPQAAGIHFIDAPPSVYRAFWFYHREHRNMYLRPEATALDILHELLACHARTGHFSNLLICAERLPLLLRRIFFAISLRLRYPRDFSAADKSGEGSNFIRAKDWDALKVALFDLLSDMADEYEDAGLQVFYKSKLAETVSVRNGLIAGSEFRKVLESVGMLVRHDPLFGKAEYRVFRHDQTVFITLEHGGVMVERSHPAGYAPAGVGRPSGCLSAAMLPGAARRKVEFLSQKWVWVACGIAAFLLGALFGWLAAAVAAIVGFWLPIRIAKRIILIKAKEEELLRREKSGESGVDLCARSRWFAGLHAYHPDSPEYKSVYQFALRTDPCLTGMTLEEAVVAHYWHNVRWFYSHEGGLAMAAQSPPKQQPDLWTFESSATLESAVQIIGLAIESLRPSGFPQMKRLDFYLKYIQDRAHLEAVTRKSDPMTFMHKRRDRANRTIVGINVESLYQEHQLLRWSRSWQVYDHLLSVLYREASGLLLVYFSEEVMGEPLKECSRGDLARQAFLHNFAGEFFEVLHKAEYLRWARTQARPADRTQAGLSLASSTRILKHLDDPRALCIEEFADFARDHLVYVDDFRLGDLDGAAVHEVWLYFLQQEANRSYNGISIVGGFVQKIREGRGLADEDFDWLIPYLKVVAERIYPQVAGIANKWLEKVSPHLLVGRGAGAMLPGYRLAYGITARLAAMASGAGAGLYFAGESPFGSFVLLIFGLVCLAVALAIPLWFAPYNEERRRSPGYRGRDRLDDETFLRLHDNHPRIAQFLRDCPASLPYAQRVLLHRQYNWRWLWGREPVPAMAKKRIPKEEASLTARVQVNNPRLPEGFATEEGLHIRPCRRVAAFARFIGAQLRVALCCRRADRGTSAASADEARMHNVMELAQLFVHHGDTVEMTAFAESVTAQRIALRLMGSYLGDAAVLSGRRSADFRERALKQEARGLSKEEALSAYFDDFKSRWRRLASSMSRYAREKQWGKVAGLNEQAKGLFLHVGRSDPRFALCAVLANSLAGGIVVIENLSVLGYAYAQVAEMLARAEEVLVEIEKLQSAGCLRLVRRAMAGGGKLDAAQALAPGKGGGARVPAGRRMAGARSFLLAAQAVPEWDAVLELLLSRGLLKKIRSGEHVQNGDNCVDIASFLARRFGCAFPTQRLLWKVFREMMRAFEPGCSRANTLTAGEAAENAAVSVVIQYYPFVSEGMPFHVFIRAGGTDYNFGAEGKGEYHVTVAVPLLPRQPVQSSETQYAGASRITLLAGRSQRRLRPAGMVLAAAFLCAFGTVIMKGVAGFTTAAQSTFLVYSLDLVWMAGVFIFICGGYKQAWGAWARLLPRHKMLLFYASLGSAVVSLFIYAVLPHMSTAMVMVLGQLNVLTAVALSRLCLGEAFSARKVQSLAGIALCVGLMIGAEYAASPFLFSRIGGEWIVKGILTGFAMGIPGIFGAKVFTALERARERKGSGYSPEQAAGLMQRLPAVMVGSNYLFSLPLLAAANILSGQPFFTFAGVAPLFSQQLLRVYLPVFLAAGMFVAMWLLLWSARSRPGYHYSMAALGMASGPMIAVFIEKAMTGSAVFSSPLWPLWTAGIILAAYWGSNGTPVTGFSGKAKSLLVWFLAVGAIPGFLASVAAGPSAAHQECALKLKTPVRLVLSKPASKPLPVAAAVVTAPAVFPEEKAQALAARVTKEKVDPAREYPRSLEEIADSVAREKLAQFVRFLAQEFPEAGRDYRRRLDLILSYGPFTCGQLDGLADLAYLVCRAPREADMLSLMLVFNLLLVMDVPERYLKQTYFSSHPELLNRSLGQDWSNRETLESLPLDPGWFWYESAGDFVIKAGRDFEEKVGYAQGGVVLHALCGAGKEAMHFARRYPGAKIFALDANPFNFREALDLLAEGRARKEELPNFRLIIADARGSHQGILLPDGCVDEVFLLGLATTSFLPGEVRSIFTEVLRVVNPQGGRVVFDEYEGEPQEVRAAIQERSDLSLTPAFRGAVESYHFPVVSVFRVSALAESGVRGSGASRVAAMLLPFFLPGFFGTVSRPDERGKHCLYLPYWFNSEKFEHLLNRAEQMKEEALDLEFQGRHTQARYSLEHAFNRVEAALGMAEGVTRTTIKATGRIPECNVVRGSLLAASVLHRRAQMYLETLVFGAGRFAEAQRDYAEAGEYLKIADEHPSELRHEWAGSLYDKAAKDHAVLGEEFVAHEKHRDAQGIVDTLLQHLHGLKRRGLETGDPVAARPVIEEACGVWARAQKAAATYPDLWMQVLNSHAEFCLALSGFDPTLRGLASQDIQQVRAFVVSLQTQGTSGYSSHVRMRLSLQTRFFAEVCARLSVTPQEGAPRQSPLSGALPAAAAVGEPDVTAPLAAVPRATPAPTATQPCVPVFAAVAAEQKSPEPPHPAAAPAGVAAALADGIAALAADLNRPAHEVNQELFFTLEEKQWRIVAYIYGIGVERITDFSRLLEKLKEEGFGFRSARSITCAKYEALLGLKQNRAGKEVLAAEMGVLVGELTDARINALALNLRIVLCCRYGILRHRIAKAADIAAVLGKAGCAVVGRKGLQGMVRQAKRLLSKAIGASEAVPVLLQAPARFEKRGVPVDGWTLLAQDAGLAREELTEERFLILTPKQRALLDLYYGLTAEAERSLRGIAQKLIERGLKDRRSKGSLNPQNVNRIRRDALALLARYRDGWEWLSCAAGVGADICRERFVLLSILEASALVFSYGLGEQRREDDYEAAQFFQERGMCDRFGNAPNVQTIRHLKVHALKRLRGDLPKAAGALIDAEKTALPEPLVRLCAGALQQKQAVCVPAAPQQGAWLELLRAALQEDVFPPEQEAVFSRGRFRFVLYFSTFPKNSGGVSFIVSDLSGEPLYAAHRMYREEAGAGCVWLQYQPGRGIDEELQGEELFRSACALWRAHVGAAAHKTIEFRSGQMDNKTGQKAISAYCAACIGVRGSRGVPLETVLAAWERVRPLLQGTAVRPEFFTHILSTYLGWSLMFVHAGIELVRGYQELCGAETLAQAWKRLEPSLAGDPLEAAERLRSLMLRPDAGVHPACTPHTLANTVYYGTGVDVRFLSNALELREALRGHFPSLPGLRLALGGDVLDIAEKLHLLLPQAREALQPVNIEHLVRFATGNQAMFSSGAIEVREALRALFPALADLRREFALPAAEAAEKAYVSLNSPESLASGSSLPACTATNVQTFLILLLRKREWRHLKQYLDVRTALWGRFPTLGQLRAFFGSDPLLAAERLREELSRDPALAHLATPLHAQHFIGFLLEREMRYLFDALPLREALRAAYPTLDLLLESTRIEAETRLEAFAALKRRWGEQAPAALVEKGAAELFRALRDYHDALHPSAPLPVFVVRNSKGKPSSDRPIVEAINALQQAGKGSLTLEAIAAKAGVKVSTLRYRMSRNDGLREMVNTAVGFDALQEELNVLAWAIIQGHQASCVPVDDFLARRLGPDEREHAQTAEKLVAELLALLDFSSGDTRKGRINLSVVTILSRLPREFLTRETAQRLSGVLEYRKAQRCGVPFETVSGAIRRLFESVSDEEAQKKGFFDIKRWILWGLKRKARSIPDLSAVPAHDPTLTSEEIRQARLAFIEFPKKFKRIKLVAQAETLRRLGEEFDQRQEEWRRKRPAVFEEPRVKQYLARTQAERSAAAARLSAAQLPQPVRVVVPAMPLVVAPATSLPPAAGVAPALTIGPVDADSQQRAAEAISRYIEGDLVNAVAGLPYYTVWGRFGEFIGRQDEPFRLPRSHKAMARLRRAGRLPKAEDPVAVIIEEDLNQGKLVSVYLRSAVVSRQPCAPLQTVKYYPELVAHGVKGSVFGVDPAELDIIDAAVWGKPLRLPGRAAFGHLRFYGYKQNLNARVSLHNVQIMRYGKNPSDLSIDGDPAQSQVDQKVVCSVSWEVLKERGLLVDAEPRKPETFPEIEVAIVVENDVNAGQLVNVYLRQDFEAGTPREPLVTYAFFKGVSGTYKSGRQENAFIPVDPLGLDILQVYYGNKRILPRQDQSLRLPVFVSRQRGKTLVRAELERHYVRHFKRLFAAGTELEATKDRIVFTLNDEAQQLFSDGKFPCAADGAMAADAAIRFDKDYGPFIELSIGIGDGTRMVVVQYAHIWSDASGSQIPPVGDPARTATAVDLDRLRLADYALGLRNIRGEPIEPQPYRYRVPRGETDAPWLQLGYRGRDVLLGRLPESLWGSDIYFKPYAQGDALRILAYRVTQDQTPDATRLPEAVFIRDDSRSSLALLGEGETIFPVAASGAPENAPATAAVAPDEDLGYALEPLPDPVKAQLPAATVGERICLLRLARGFQMKATLCHLASIPTNTYVAIERREGLPHARYLLAIARALRVDPSWIIKGVPLEEALGSVRYPQTFTLLRLRRGWTQEDLARRLIEEGMSFDVAQPLSGQDLVEAVRPTIAQWENGVTPSAEKRAIVNRVLGRDVFGEIAAAEKPAAAAPATSSGERRQDKEQRSAAARSLRQLLKKLRALRGPVEEMRQALTAIESEIAALKQRGAEKPLWISSETLQSLFARAQQLLQTARARIEKAAQRELTVRQKHAVDEEAAHLRRQAKERAVQQKQRLKQSRQGIKDFRRFVAEALGQIKRLQDMQALEILQAQVRERVGKLREDAAVSADARFLRRCEKLESAFRQRRSRLEKRAVAAAAPRPKKEAKQKHDPNAQPDAAVTKENPPSPGSEPGVHQGMMKLLKAIAGGKRSSRRAAHDTAPEPGDQELAEPTAQDLRAVEKEAQEALARAQQMEKEERVASQRPLRRGHISPRQRAEGTQEAKPRISAKAFHRLFRPSDLNICFAPPKDKPGIIREPLSDPIAFYLPTAQKIAAGYSRQAQECDVDLDDLFENATETVRALALRVHRQGLHLYDTVSHRFFVGMEVIIALEQLLERAQRRSSEEAAQDEEQPAAAAPEAEESGEEQSAEPDQSTAGQPASPSKAAPSAPAASAAPAALTAQRLNDWLRNNAVRCSQLIDPNRAGTPRRELTLSAAELAQRLGCPQSAAELPELLVQVNALRAQSGFFLFSWARQTQNIGTAGKDVALGK